MLLCASVASGAAPLIAADHTPNAEWLRSCGQLLSRVAALGPRSEPAGLLLLGSGFVLVAYQIRRKH
jgi:hypothetical protein